MNHPQEYRMVGLIVLMCAAIGLHAQENAADRFWYGTDPATVRRFFPDERMASRTGNAILEEPVVILKREIPFARIELTPMATCTMLQGNTAAVFPVKASG